MTKRKILLKNTEYLTLTEIIFSSLKCIEIVFFIRKYQVLCLLINTTFFGQVRVSFHQTWWKCIPRLFRICDTIFTTPGSLSDGKYNVGKKKTSDVKKAFPSTKPYAAKYSPFST